MRTTLDIDDDILLAVKELSKRQRKSAGEVLSDLARAALTAPVSETHEPETPYGFPLIPRKSDTIVTVDQIRRLQEESEL